MIFIKACPKCKGDIEFTIDSFGKSLECLQCSYTVDSKESAKRAIGETQKSNV
tara:strand:- start:191 stop:349 length:159 start_codon:yes stop_codon:yes gene_type:complete